MADDEILLSGEIEYLEGAAAPHGDGFYFAVLDGSGARISDWVGPCSTRATAEADFLKHAEQIIKTMAAELLKLR